VTLAQLAADEGAGKITIPIGAVIVSSTDSTAPHGHAALFNGIVKVGGLWQIITCDANDSDGWNISLSGTPSTDDPNVLLLSLPGHQAGQHVARLQWVQITM
jgi:hypothetical protein